MATYTKENLSQSSSGKSIVVSLSNTAQVGTLIHTTQTSATVVDEVWVYGSNPGAFDVNLTITFGGSAVPRDVIFNGTLEAYSGNVLLVPGLILEGTGTVGSSIYAWSSILSTANIFGYVNRIS